MSKKQSLRVCVNTNNQISKLFSIVERKGGDLVISLSSAEKLRPINGKHDDSAPKITHQKYSVHCSNDSPTNINVLNHLIEFDNDEQKTISHYTKAIKQTNKFAPLFGARTPDISIQRYAVKEDTNKIILTTYNPKKSTLFYMVNVCRISDPLPKYSSNYNFKYIKFKKFNILVIWSFINIPSHTSGARCHFETMPPEDIAKNKVSLAEGYDAIQLLNSYKNVISSSIIEFGNTLMNEDPEFYGNTINVILNIPYTAEPIFQD